MLEHLPALSLMGATAMIFNRQNPPPGYYVYLYLRKKDLSPYYVGKGKGRRAWDNSHHVKVPTDMDRIIIIEHSLTNAAACFIEKVHIRMWGRVDLGTGILRNMTIGGDGVSGYKHRPETLEKMRQSMLGRKQSPEHSEKISKSLRGKSKSNPPWNKGLKLPPQTAEANAKRRAALQGRQLSEETKEKMSQASIGKNKGRIPWNKGLKMSAPSPKKGQPSPLKGIKSSADSIEKRRKTMEQKKLAGLKRSDSGKRKPSDNTDA